MQRGERALRDRFPTKKELRPESPKLLVYQVVELRGIEPLTSSMPRKRAPAAPQPHSRNEAHYREPEEFCQPALVSKQPPAVAGKPNVLTDPDLSSYLSPEGERHAILAAGTIFFSKGDMGHATGTDAENHVLLFSCTDRSFSFPDLLRRSHER